MNKIHELYYRLNALYIFYKSVHLLSKSLNFYQNHKFFGELYEKIDDELDALAELTLAFDESDKAFDAKTILEQSSKLAQPTANKFIDNIKLASEQELAIIELIDDLQVNKIPAGLYNHIASIAQNHSRNSYLLSRINEK
jgi:DNA-binding ferritin-like protein